MKTTHTIILLITLGLTGCTGRGVLHKAKLMYDTKDYQGSITLLRLVIARSPQDHEALAYMGFNYQKLNENDSAYAYLSQAITAGDTSYMILVNAGDAAFKSGHSIEAFNYISAAYRRDSTSATVNYDLGILLWQRFQAYDRALYHLHRVSALSPHDADVMGAIAQIYVNIDSTDSAVHYFTQAIAIDPRDYNWYVFRAYAYCSVSRFREGIADFTTAHELDDSDQQVLLERATAYLQMDSTAEACADLHRITDQRYYPAADSLVRVHCR